VSLNEQGVLIPKLQTKEATDEAQNEAQTKRKRSVRYLKNEGPVNTQTKL
jgi:hypothetical protein